mgnify:CR=1 FL=1
MDKKRLISICIPTFKRQLLLSDLLLSLSKIKIPDDYSVEYIIIDNDENGSAREVADEFKYRINFKVKYIIQPVKNISIARNTALENAEGELIAFIDDDETADENWLNNLFICLNKFNADGVFGLVVPRFENGTDEKYKKREYYFSEMDESGTDARFMFSGSVLIKSEVIKEYKIYFDPEFGLTGGEDADFFNRLKSKGAKFVNCREAVSYEYISKDRTKLKFFLNRFIRGGQTYTRNLIKSGGRVKAIIVSVKSVLKLLVGTILLLPSVFSTHFRIISLMYIGNGIGELRGLTGWHKNLH